MEFGWDPQKASANLAKHTVSFEEAATVFGDPLGRIVAGPRHSPEYERVAPMGFRAKPFASSARGVPRGVSEERMKRSKRKATDQPDSEILPEYDFSGALPNKHASRYAAGSAVVVLEPDVAAAFPSSGEVNDALRALAGIIQKHRSRRPASRRAF